MIDIDVNSNLLRVQGFQKKVAIFIKSFLYTCFYRIFGSFFVPYHSRIFIITIIDGHQLRMWSDYNPSYYYLKAKILNIFVFDKIISIWRNLFKNNRKKRNPFSSKICINSLICFSVSFYTNWFSCTKIHKTYQAWSLYFESWL